MPEGIIGTMPSKMSGEEKFESGSPEIEEALKAAEGEVKEVVVRSRLAQYIREQWQMARDARAQTVDKIMLQNLRQVRGKYDPDHLAAIRSGAGGSEVYMMITNNIAMVGASRVKSILKQADRLWNLDPGSVPELPPDVEKAITEQVTVQTIQDVGQEFAMSGKPFDNQTFASELGRRVGEMKENALTLIEAEASDRLEGMGRKIQEQWDDGGGPEALDACITDFFRNVGCFLKGPIVRNEKKIHWVKGKNGKYKMESGVERKVVFERVAPENIYPLVGTTSIRHGGLIEFHRLSRKDLSALIGLPGYNDDEIRAVLEDYGQGGLNEWTTQTINSEVANILDEHPPDGSPQDELIDALQLWAPVQGSMLLDYGMPEKRIPDPDIDYEVDAWLIGNHVIRCVLNPNPLGEHPYSSTGYQKEPDCFWHTSMPEIVRGPQMQCNASGGRALANNVAIASGPAVEMDIDRVQNAAGMKIKPWMKILSTSDQMTSGNAVKFNDIPLKAGPLMEIYNQFEQKAYMYAGIPNPSSMEINPTVGGTSIAETDRNKGIQELVSNIEKDLVHSAISRLYNFNMLYDEDESIKGDATIKIKGIHSITSRELKLRRDQEMYAATNNPTDMAITGPEGRRNWLRMILRELGNDPDDITLGNLEGAGQAPPPAKPAETDVAGNRSAGRDYSVVNQ